MNERNSNKTTTASGLEALKLYPIRCILFVLSSIVFIFLQSHSFIGWPNLNLNHWQFALLSAFSLIAMLGAWTSLYGKVS